MWYSQLMMVTNVKDVLQWHFEIPWIHKRCSQPTTHEFYIIDTFHSIFFNHLFNEKYQVFDFYSATYNKNINNH